MTSNIVGRPIVAAVDGSASALHAARWAAAMAAGRHAPLRLVHAVNIPALAYGAGLGPPTGFFEALQSDGRQRLIEAETALRAENPDLDLGIELKVADPVPALIDESGKARLVVLGSRGLGGFSGVLAGSTAVAVVAHGHCPVAVVRGSEPDAAPPAHGPVVVGVDGSPNSELALATAFEEASWRNAELVAVHAWIEYSTDSAYGYAHQSFVDWDAVDTRERELLAERLAGWQEKYPDVEVRRVVARRRPVASLLEQSADAQLLVVGSHGHGGFAGMILGSTSQALIYHAPCPLMVVRPATL